MDEDGFIFLVDRVKDMIISSGENVYPREIEEVVSAYPGVAECSVIAIPDACGARPSVFMWFLGKGRPSIRRPCASI